MAFGIGASARASSFGEQWSTSRDAADAAASSFGEGSSSSVGGSRSTSSVFQGDVFQSLFRDAGNVAGAIAGGAGGLTGAANSLFDQGTGFLADLQTLSGPGPVGAGEEYLQGRVTGQGSELDAQIAGLEGDLSKFFGESLLPQINSGAVAAGQMGGGRQGVAEGMAIDAMGREFTSGVTALRSTELAARSSAAAALAGSQQNRRLGAAGAGMSALPGQYGLLESGSMAGLSPYMALAGILGGPAVMTDSESYSESESADVSGSQSVSSSRSSSDSYGYDRSNSKSKSFNIGGGG